MDEPKTLVSQSQLARRFETLHQERHRRVVDGRETRPKRKTLTKDERAQVLEKTAGRCHLCGGSISSNGKWHADHVLAHASGGRHSIDNYLPAHKLCNKYRWDYSAEQVQWILKVGVWAVSEMRRETRVGLDMGERYAEHEERRILRRTSTI
jgi:hypothetical protein